jgi:hypothetical protein
MYIAPHKMQALSLEGMRFCADFFAPFNSAQFRAHRMMDPTLFQAGIFNARTTSSLRAILPRPNATR